MLPSSFSLRPSHSLFPPNLFLLLLLLLGFSCPSTDAFTPSPTSIRVTPTSTSTLRTASTPGHLLLAPDQTSSPPFAAGRDVCPPEEPYVCSVYKDRIQADLAWACNASLCCGGLFVHQLCPITCGLCPEPCGGQKCQNDGQMNYETCTCECKGHLGGPSCGDCVEQDDDWCPSFLPRTRCGQHGGPVPYRCPHFCGLCPDTCGGKQCQNHGVLNITTCSCECPGSFSGTSCEVCPADDHAICQGKQAWMCDQEPFTFFTMQTYCPYLCGVCTKATSEAMQ